MVAFRQPWFERLFSFPGPLRTAAFPSNGGCAASEVWGWKSHESCLRKIVVGEAFRCWPDMFLLRMGWSVCLRARLPGLPGGDWPSEVGNPNGAQAYPRVPFRAFSRCPP